jgi:hypothetical protein
LQGGLGTPSELVKQSCFQLNFHQTQNLMMSYLCLHLRKSLPTFWNSCLCHYHENYLQIGFLLLYTDLVTFLPPIFQWVSSRTTAWSFLLQKESELDSFVENVCHRQWWRKTVYLPILDHTFIV